MNYSTALLGGALIGLAVTLMLALNGRVAGVSGILNLALAKPVKSSFWRLSFLGGLLVGGFTAYLINPQFFVNASGRNLLELLSAGFLVGFGSALGGGCTSGHGVCGVSRLSPRSLVATGIFIAAGMVMVASLRWLGWAL